MLVFAVYSNGNTWLTTDLTQLQAKLQSERGLVDKRIDQLDPDLSIEGSELVPVFQDGETRRVTIDQILDEAEERISSQSSFRRKVELTGSRALLPTDIGCHLFYSGASPITITIPDNIFVDPQQDLIDVEIAQLGTGVVTITPADVTVNGGSSSIPLTQNKSIVLVFYSSDILNVLSSGVSDSDPRLSDARPASSASDNAIGDRTADPSQTPSGNVGKLTQWLSWLTNRIKAITGATNWFDSPATTLANTASHISNTSNPHNVTASQVGADVTGTAAGLMTAHTSAADPHSQYALGSALGTISTQSANNVAITGGSINGTTIGATTPSTIRGTTAILSSSLRLSGTNTQTTITSYDGGSGNDVILQCDPSTGTSTASAQVRFFRGTNTTGTAGFIVHTADNTFNINCYFAANRDSYFNALIGNVGIGLIPNTNGAKAQALSLYVGAAAAVAPGTGNIQASGTITAGTGLRIGTGATVSSILTATKTITSPSTTDTITVTGAVVGDIVELSRGINGFVSAANTVQFDSTGLSGVTVRAAVLRYT